MKKRILRIFTLYLITVFLFACAKEETEKSTTSSRTTSSGSTAASGFQALNKNVLGPKCGSCHASELASYNSLMNSGWVVPRAAAKSTLYHEVYTGQMPQNGSRLSNTELNTIYNWIQAGALNN